MENSQSVINLLRSFEKCCEIAYMNLNFEQNCLFLSKIENHSKV